MSIPVELSELAATLAAYPWGYLVTVGDGLRAHSLAVPTDVDAYAADVTPAGPPLEDGAGELVDGREGLPLPSDDQPEVIAEQFQQLLARTSGR